MSTLSQSATHPLYDQLIQQGFCHIPDVAPPALIEEMHLVTDQLIAHMTPEEQSHSRLQGSLINVLDHHALGKLIALSQAIDALRALGFQAPKFYSGYIISKPPQKAPALFWHQDGINWSEPINYTDTPVQLFLMYYLIDTDRTNGCLRIIPGSHRKRHQLHGLAAPDTPEIQQAQEGHPALEPHPDEVDVPVCAGDLIVGDARLLHAAHPNRSAQRRTCVTLWFCPLYDQLPESLQAVYGRPLEKPDHWPDEAWTRLEPLLGRYEGSALPLERNRVPGPQLK